MLIKKPADIRYSEITPKSLYLNRRQFLAGVPAAFLAGRELLSPSRSALAGTKLPNVGKSPFSTTRSRTLQRRHPLQQLLRVRHRQGRSRPSYAKNFKTSPWTVSVEGDVRQAAQVQPWTRS